MNTNHDALPCPFCGGEVDPEGWLGGDGRRGPECNDCGATADSMEAWNRRAPMAARGWKPTEAQFKEWAGRHGVHLERERDAFFDAASLYLTASPAASEGAKHPDDEAVDRFAQAMKEKLAAAREKGRGGWQTCSREDLSWMLRDHVAKGDPRDVANFCMFLWNLGHGISAPTDAERTERAAHSDAQHSPLTEAERLRRLLSAALGALQYHTEQTRPIQRTRETIDAIQRELAAHGIGKDQA